ncbi:TOG array regulator of axonemal microtubules protein 2 isoform X1 [Mauremys reevesii]|uniref:TOG array regulator of axonemal microtubules protein 2 isoform X1 n=1 Tax=Mauremys reevesii TaxID=260615 RepID=UPI00194011A8|nr:TOG array regulator of axonemal microtubules protein 2 isoform X1 [Mauremys reevesii]XP_039386023.1 TOG array regulator of axonemal microtubules protein 2 isoform X1 [Mauremys reevesii]XP_039386024.1 TOG array regulator of axonemal microtubules protein 2 isoform X1 [Mauremys reevesii]XP_039386025.1 TOG array regulator of axonemal microtubules protein 2 isoform X1 [Mauremys reevesii]
MATHDDFTAAKYQAPVAVYCGSVPKVKPGYRSLRGGSIDSNLQLYGSRWTTADEASLQSVLKVQMKKQSCLWSGDGGLPYPRAISSLEGLDSPTLKQDPKELEVSSAAMETAQIKDKLKKRRISEGLFASHRGLLDSSGPKEVALKPAVSRSASQRLLLTSKPMPPIQSIPTSPEANGTDEREQKTLENGMVSWGHGEAHTELTPTSQETSRHYLHCNDEKMRKSLGSALIPPIPKSVRPPDGDSGNFPMPLSSSQQLDQAALTIQESAEIRSRPDSNAEEKILKSLEFRTLEPILPAPQNGLTGSMKPAEYLLPLTTLSLSQAKETGPLSSPHLLKDDDWKESNGRIHVTISKSAQEKMRQKQMKEMELLRSEREKEKEREKERSLQLHEQLQNVDTEVIAQEVPTGFGLLNTNGIISITPNVTNPCRASVGIALKKRVNRPSLPSIPIINHDSSFMRHSSANSLPANILDSPEGEEESECGEALEMRPFSHPEQGLVDALKWLNSNDWPLKEKGLFSIKCLATCHSEVLLCRLHDVSLAVTREVSNLRSKVSRFAISILGELFRTMKKHMDQEVEEITRVLLHKTGDSSEFIQKAADRSLGIMVGSVTPMRAMAALMAGGVNHRNPPVRKCAAEHLLTVMEQIGAEKLLSGTRDNTELLVQTLVKLAQDCNQDTRFYGRKMLNVLMPHPKFDGYLKQSLPSHNLRNVMATIKQKGMEDNVSEPPSAKGRRESRNSSLTTSQDSLPSSEGSRSDTLAPAQPVVRRSSLRSVEAMEQLKELNKLLMAKEFQTRMEGVTLLVEHCRNNPQFVSANIVQIFDAFTLRLQDSNKKVNQHALESAASMIPILKDGLHPVVVSMVTVVTDNLNSKNSGIYTAAVRVLDTMIANLGTTESCAELLTDNVLLLQAFASRVHFISGRAMQDITEHLSALVSSVYPRKPQAVERHTLPVLWYFLNNMIGNGVLPGRSGNVRTVVCKLVKSLYKEMGHSLKDHASSQPQHVIKSLWDLLDMELQ